MSNRIALSLIAATGVAALSTNAAADMLANWTFETSGPGLGLTDSTISPVATAEAGVFAGSSFASGLHALAATDWSSPVGNGSAESFSANQWTTGDYWQFSTSSLGYENITISWDQTRSGTGPATFDLEYSNDGTTWFTALNDYTVLESSVANGGTWNSTTFILNYHYSYVFGPIELDNQATIYFRMTSQVTLANTGTNRVDNIEITGDAIAAPGALALLGLAGPASRSRRRN